MITQAGPMCDYCGHYILPIDPDENVNFFQANGIANLCCHNKCVKGLLDCGKEWEKLPDESPLKKAFQNALKPEGK